MVSVIVEVPGLPGPPNSLTIGSVSTAATGAPADASITGTPPSQVLNLTIPKGDAGDAGVAGPANTLSIGTVTSGSSPSATITGTAPNQTLNLVLQQGPAGSTGSAGPANSLAIGTVTGLAAGATPTATITG